MNIIKKLYNLYKQYLADILLLILVFFLVYFARNIPYLNILILNIDPLLTGVVIVWIIYYLIKTPSASRIMKFALILFVSNYFLVLINRVQIAELLSSLSFSMIFTAIIVEILRLKRELKKEKVQKN